MNRLQRRSFGLVLAFVALLTSTILIGGVIVTTAGCATPASVAGQSTANLTAPGIQALHGKEVVKYLDIIRDLAIDAEAAGKIPTATTANIIRWHKAAINTINQTPNGWKATVLTGMDAVQAALTPAEHGILDPYFLTAKTIIQAVIA
jgi:hypothetical protein